MKSCKDGRRRRTLAVRAEAQMVGDGHTPLIMFLAGRARPDGVSNLPLEVAQGVERQVGNWNFAPRCCRPNPERREADGRVDLGVDIY